MLHFQQYGLGLDAFELYILFAIWLTFSRSFMTAFTRSRLGFTEKGWSYTVASIILEGNTGINGEFLGSSTHSFCHLVISDIYTFYDSFLV